MGDLESFVHGDHILVTSRKKDPTIVRRRGNVTTREIEDTLLADLLNADAAPVSMPDRKMGRADLRVHHGAEYAASDLAQVTLCVLGQTTTDRVELVADLPRTAVGKTPSDILRAAAAKLLEAMGR